MFWFLLLFLLIGNNGWGNGYGVNGAANEAAVMYPWMNQQGQTAAGFRDQMLSSKLDGIQGSITSGFGDVQLGLAGINQNICQTGNAIVGAVTGAQNSITQQMYQNQIADMERSFNAQTAQMQGFSALQSGIADNRYAMTTEACANRNSAMQNTRDIIDNQNRNYQMIIDKLCALELGDVKNQLAQSQRDNVALQNQLNMANYNAAMTAQNALFQQGLNQEVDALYNRLKNCPVNSVPVYGNQPVYTVPANGCGCGQ